MRVRLSTVLDVVLLFALVCGSAAVSYAVGAGTGRSEEQGRDPLESTELPAVREAPDGPVERAKEWLVAYRSVSYADPSPTAWVDRVRPLSTQQLARELARARDGSTGADWAAFVARRCYTTVEQLDGTIPDEAPRSGDTVYVQLSATAVTRCAAGRDRAEPLALTVAVAREADGGWRVSRRLF